MTRKVSGKKIVKEITEKLKDLSTEELATVFNSVFSDKKVTSYDENQDVLVVDEQVED